MKAISALISPNSISVNPLEEQRQEKILWGKIAVIYFFCFAVNYLDMPFPVRLFAITVLMVFQLQSYLQCSAIMFMALFFPFFGALLGKDLAGMNAPRILFLVYLYQSLQQQRKRQLQMDSQMLALVIISIGSLRLTADILYFVQDVPLSMGQVEKKSIKNLMADYYEFFTIVGFLYFSFTRLTIKQINQLLNILTVFIAVEAICIIFLVAQNPKMVLGYGNLEDDEFDIFYLWRNPYFGHKNDWGMMFVFVMFATLMRKFTNPKKYSKYYLIVIILACTTIALSLSRQALVFTIIGFLFISILKFDSKILVGFLAAACLVIIIQPDFLMERMDTMLNVSSTDDFQSLSRKVSDLALDQVVANFQFLPRMFFVDWEYNYSEGFWNGMMHQQGILGLFFHFYIYIFLFIRFFSYYKTKNFKVSTYGIYGMVLITLMFWANFNRRSTHLLHYKGGFTQINFVVLFMFFYMELIYYAYIKKLKDFKYL